MTSTELEPNSQSESQIVRRIKEWEIMRQSQLLEGFDLQFESPKLSKDGTFLIGEIREIIPSAAASDVIAEIESLVAKSTNQTFVIVTISNHINKLNEDQRLAVYGLIASCCRDDERPVIRPGGEVEDSVRGEIEDFMSDLYHWNSSTYDKAELILQKFNAKLESAKREEAH